MVRQVIYQREYFFLSVHYLIDKTFLWRVCKNRTFLSAQILILLLARRPALVWNNEMSRDPVPFHSILLASIIYLFLFVSVKAVS